MHVRGISLGGQRWKPGPYLVTGFYAIASDERVRTRPIWALVVTVALMVLSSGCALLQRGRVVPQAEGVAPEVLSPSDKAKGLAHFAQGMLFLAHNEVGEAEGSFAEAVRLDPSSSAVLLKLGEVQAAAISVRESVLRPLVRWNEWWGWSLTICPTIRRWLPSMRARKDRTK